MDVDNGSVKLNELASSTIQQSSETDLVLNHSEDAINNSQSCDILDKTHLESNINVIENENNENLERDINVTRNHIVADQQFNHVEVRDKLVENNVQSEFVDSDGTQQNEHQPVNIKEIMSNESSNLDISKPEKKRSDTNNSGECPNTGEYPDSGECPDREGVDNAITEEEETEEMCDIEAEDPISVCRDEKINDQAASSASENVAEGLLCDELEGPATQLEIETHGSEKSSDPCSSESTIEPIKGCEGADEAVTILPDSERDFTEEEQEAALSLPALKDILDITKELESTSSVQDENDKLKDNDMIQVYVYEKQDEHACYQCKQIKPTQFYFKSDETVQYICGGECMASLKASSSKPLKVVSGVHPDSFHTVTTLQRLQSTTAFRSVCVMCKKKIQPLVDKGLVWDTKSFCSLDCLGKQQQQLIGSKCSHCDGVVKDMNLGKFCVRFGAIIRQFCSSACLDNSKKGLKMCALCLKMIPMGSKSVLAVVGKQFKDFCSDRCMNKYEALTNDNSPTVPEGATCSVCKEFKLITLTFDHNGVAQFFCGDPCMVAFSFVNKIQTPKCPMCRRPFIKIPVDNSMNDVDPNDYCSLNCRIMHMLVHRKIVSCKWCKVRKYDTDMIRLMDSQMQGLHMCSINCYNMYLEAAATIATTHCTFCQKISHLPFDLTISDGTIKNFCSYQCMTSYQDQFSDEIIQEDIPTSEPAVQTAATTKKPTTVTSASNGGDPKPAKTRVTIQTVTSAQSPVLSQQQQVQFKQLYVQMNRAVPETRNVGIMVQSPSLLKPIPTTKDAAIQTDQEPNQKFPFPIPLPIYVPSPCHMFSTPVPFPVPFPVPIPIPIFIPTTRNSAAGIMKEIKKIQVKIPTDPYEAELLMMAEMVAEERKEDHTDSESDLDDNNGDGGGAGEYSPEPVDTNNSFGDDVLQMALKMATELDEPAVDLEGALTASTITAPQGGAAPTDGTVLAVDGVSNDNRGIHAHLLERSPTVRGRKRPIRGGNGRGSQSKRGRRMSHHQVDMPMMQVVQPTAPQEPQEKPDANMCLKYTFGVNAWKQWVTTKNAELEKSARRVKLFKTEILQLTADELNYSLCLFVKEVRKPNGQEYAPDTIYYLCLGIQQYLFENGRIDNIFCDPYYEKFTDCLDEVAKKFSVLYNDSHYIVTRVEEEHLWESKQLGAHSPHVLLSTLMFFNTKHFNLTTVDEHMQLSFSHIMKHWKRNPNQPAASKVPGSRNVLLRFYPPQAALQNNQRKKKVYEQQENEENPLRCPVKLYEFYLSKCPESVKTRNDVFYLQPERSCVPDSPVWYSTMPLAREALEKMLHRVKMVKEINVALLTS